MHTVKFMIISTLDKRVLYHGPLWNGNAADVTMFRKELSHINFSGKKVHLDLAFEGLANQLPGADIKLPHKKPKLQKLTDIQKEQNTEKSKVRVAVENALAGTKRYYILRIENRFKYQKKTCEAFDLCVGLWNFKSSFRMYRS